MAESDLKFCPRCSGNLEWRRAGDALSEALHRVCVACGYILWQNRKASVEALIMRQSESGPEIPLGLRKSGEGWDMPGNFLNSTDRIEEVLIQECRREIGVEIEIKEILGAFEDDFMDSAIVSIVYICSIKDGTPRPEGQIDDLQWFPLNQPPSLAFSSVKGAVTALQLRLLQQ